MGAFTPINVLKRSQPATPTESLPKKRRRILSSPSSDPVSSKLATLALQELSRTNSSTGKVSGDLSEQMSDANGLATPKPQSPVSSRRSSSTAKVSRKPFKQTSDANGLPVPASPQSLLQIMLVHDAETKMGRHGDKQAHPSSRKKEIRRNKSLRKEEILLKKAVGKAEAAWRVVHRVVGQEQSAGPRAFVKQIPSEASDCALRQSHRETSRTLPARQVPAASGLPSNYRDAATQTETERSRPTRQVANVSGLSSNHLHGVTLTEAERRRQFHDLGQTLHAERLGPLARLQRAHRAFERWGFQPRG